MKTVYESSLKPKNTHMTLTTYKNVSNIPHYHTDFELIYVHSGESYVITNEKRYTLRRGDCIFIHTNDIHCISSENGAITSVIKADAAFFGNLLSSKRLESPLLKNTLCVEALISEINDEISKKSEYSDLIADNLLMNFFARMLRNETVFNVHDERSNLNSNNTFYEKITRKIISDYATLKFDEAAAFMHFSTPYFSKIFTKIFGMTFTEYLNTVRIAFAIEYIRNDTLKITDVATKCGFNTIRNFNRVFKDFTGYTPNTLPKNYVFVSNLIDTNGLDPTLSSTEIIELPKKA